MGRKGRNMPKHNMSLSESRRQLIRRIGIIVAAIGFLIVLAILITPRVNRMAILEKCCAGNARDIAVMGENLIAYDYQRQCEISKLRKDLDAVTKAQERLQEQVRQIMQIMGNRGGCR